MNELFYISAPFVIPALLILVLSVIGIVFRIKDITDNFKL